MSHSPGTSVLPATATVGTPAGIVTAARGPTSAMRPSRTRTTPSGIGGRAGAVDDRRADHRIGAALQRRVAPRDRFEIADPIARRALDELHQRRLEVLAHRLEAEAAGARDRRRQRLRARRATRVSRPQTTPSIAIALEHGHAVAPMRIASRPRASMKTSLVGRPGTVRNDARLAVPLPVAQQQHLRRERRVAVHREELRRQRHARFARRRRGRPRRCRRRARRSRRSRTDSSCPSPGTRSA